jgi:hypothetical protein
MIQLWNLTLHSLHGAITKVKQKGGNEKKELFDILTVPDRRRRNPEVVLVRRWVTWVLGIWRGEGLGRGLRKGRSVYKQPETEVDGSCHS